MLAKRVERSGVDWDQHLPFTLFAYRNPHESPFFLQRGHDPRLPSVLDFEPPARRVEQPLDSHKEELSSSLFGEWDLAREHVEKAQKAQKRAYDRRFRKVEEFRVGDWVFVHMPKDKACKAYKFARPFHGPYRVVEALESGLVVRPVHRLQEATICVALYRVRHCPKAVPEDSFWPRKTPGRTSGRSPPPSVNVDSDPAPSVLRGRLRGNR